jgi:hypothetical protein
MSNKELLFRDMELSIDEMLNYNHKILCNQLKEIALEYNPILLTLDKAEFVIEPSTMPPRIEICFMFYYKENGIYVYENLEPKISNKSLTFYFNPGFIFSVLENRVKHTLRKILKEEY